MTTNIIAIDPGTVRTGWVTMDEISLSPMEFGVCSPLIMRRHIEEIIDYCERVTIVIEKPV